MITPEDPPSFIVRTEAQKAAFDNGYRLERGISEGWMHYASTTAQGDIWIAGVSGAGSWLLSLDHPGMPAELADMPPSPVSGPGISTFLFDTSGQLHATLDRVYRLSVSLPDVPLRRFQEQTASMPLTTEAERLVVQRVGQNVFRAALLHYWSDRCPLTGVAEPRLLRASHIKPWADCGTDAERMDVHNGFLLATHLDAAFDAGLISFDDDGAMLFSHAFAHADRVAIGLADGIAMPSLSARHRQYLVWHRERVFFNEAPDDQTGALA